MVLVLRHSSTIGKQEFHLDLPQNLNMRLNNLLAEFSHCDSGTLSTLFRTYCINIYGCQTWG